MKKTIVFLFTIVAFKVYCQTAYLIGVEELPQNIFKALTFRNNGYLITTQKDSILFFGNPDSLQLKVDDSSFCEKSYFNYDENFNLRLINTHKQEVINFLFAKYEGKIILAGIIKIDKQSSIFIPYYQLASFFNRTKINNKGKSIEYLVYQIVDRKILKKMKLLI